MVALVRCRGCRPDEGLLCHEDKFEDVEGADIEVDDGDLTLWGDQHIPGMQVIMDQPVPGSILGQFIDRFADLDPLGPYIVELTPILERFVLLFP